MKAESKLENVFQVFKNNESAKIEKISTATELMEQMDILKNIDRDAPTNILNTTEIESISSDQSSCTEDETTFPTELCSGEEYQVGKKRKISRGLMANAKKNKRQAIW